MADRPDTPKLQPHRGLCLIETNRSRIVVRSDP
jgi:hypothetical protein